MHASFGKHCEQQIIHGRLFGEDHVPAPFDLAARAAREHDGQVVVCVGVAVADAAAVDDQGMIQQGAVAITG